MTLAIRELERTDTRVLGAIRCLDASTGTPVEPTLEVRIPGATVRRNRSGLYVIVQADALASHAVAFSDPPLLPAVGSVDLVATMRDPVQRYLPRNAAVALPRDPRPGRADSVFRPIDVPMYPSASAPVGVNWSVLRATVHRDGGSRDLLCGALLLVISGDDVLARGLSDWRGEALVPVPGVPITTWSNQPGAVVVNEIQALVQAVFDPLQGTRTTRANVDAGHAPAAPAVVDPDDLEARRLSLPRAQVELALASGRTQTVSLALALP